MLNFFPGEEWKPAPVYHKLQQNYAISNYGRVVSYTDSIENGKIIKGTVIKGRRVFRYKVPVAHQKPGEPKTMTWYVARLVAELFIGPPTEERNLLARLDHNWGNDYYKNLRWMSVEELGKHNAFSPGNMAARERIRLSPRQQGHKLNTTQVIRIKKMLFDPNRRTRMRIIAKQFGISEMQLFRIKSGENWGHVKI